MAEQQELVERLREGLEVVARQVEGWLEWDKEGRNKEGLITEDGTHIMALPVPVWPTHGALRNWAKLFRETSEALSGTSQS